LPFSFDFRSVGLSLLHTGFLLKDTWCISAVSLGGTLSRVKPFDCAITNYLRGR